MQINPTVQSIEFNPTFEKVAEKTKPVEVITPKEPAKEISRDQTEKLSELKTALEENNITLQFSQDEKTNALVVRLIDKITGEEILQLPTEVSLKLVAINAKLNGHFIDQQS